MSILWVLNEVTSRESPVLIGEFVFFIGDISDQPNAKILQYYSGYEDMVVSPLMLDAFEHDIHTFIDEVAVRAKGQRQLDPLSFLEPLIATAPEHRAYIVIMGD